MEASESLKQRLKELSELAPDLHKASDELQIVVAAIDAHLKKLNLGVSAWIDCSVHQDNDGTYWSRGLGYTRLKGNWGLSIRHVMGVTAQPVRKGNTKTNSIKRTSLQQSEEVWPFAEAPRYMRIETIGKIPELLEALVNNVRGTTRSLQKKTIEAAEFVAVINQASESNSEPVVEMCARCNEPIEDSQTMEFSHRADNKGKAHFVHNFACVEKK